VRLKDQATIPNKDFVLKYDVAGSGIEDALLTHRDSKGGFFTFILQPPRRVTAADTMPKELVFVLDTSGSMAASDREGQRDDDVGARWALSTGHLQRNSFLWRHQNSFFQSGAGDPGKHKQAKNLLASAKGDGGTEMMKAIRAALAPSDAQDHVRITCFMTDARSETTWK